MQHGGDFASNYAVHHYPPPPAPANPSSGDFSAPQLFPPSYPSAPSYSFDFKSPVHTSSTASSPSTLIDGVGGHNSYAPPYNQKPEPSSYFPHQSEFPFQTPQIPPYQAYNSSSYLSEQSPAAAYPPPRSQQGPSPALYYPHNANQQKPVSYESLIDPRANPHQKSSLSTTHPSYDGSYGSDSAGRYHQSSSLGNDGDFYDKKHVSGGQYDQFGHQEKRLDVGVYQYDGGNVEPYGARGTVPTRSQALFEDFGPSSSFPSGGKDPGDSLSIAKALPKMDAEQDMKNSMQKFRVKLLSEEGGSSTVDVICQIGFDGIHILDPITNRTMRVYSLGTVKRCEVTDPSTFTFWYKSHVDNDPRRIRLQSNSNITRTILDTVTATTVQLKEMGGKESFVRGSGSSDAGNQPEQPADKKKSIIDWMNFRKPANEEKEHWVPDEAVSKCTSCKSDFGAFNRRHHCRNCGDIFCAKCTQGRIALTAEENAQPVRVCNGCMPEVTQRLSSAKKASSGIPGPQNHEDLARKLQVELNRNCKSSSDSKSSDESSKPMIEVACPTCTIHLQVQVPASGSNTVECGICQCLFRVNADSSLAAY